MARRRQKAGRPLAEAHQALCTMVACVLEGGNDWHSHFTTSICLSCGSSQGRWVGRLGWCSRQQAPACGTAAPASLARRRPWEIHVPGTTALWETSLCRNSGGTDICGSREKLLRNTDSHPHGNI